MMVFFQAKLGKILIFQNFSETWESDFKNFTGKHLCQILFLNKVAGLSLQL